MKKATLLTSLILFFTVGCSGLKVINPNDQNKDQGTLALDTTDGKLNLVPTFTCKVESMGSKFSAVGKDQTAATNEVIAKCRNKTALSFCKFEKVTCQKN